jgi:hypothetical protein
VRALFGPFWIAASGAAASGRALATREPFIIEDIDDEPAFPLGLIVSEGKVVGMPSTHFRARRKFSTTASSC